jgi:hypothetical protein
MTVAELKKKYPDLETLAEQVSDGRAIFINKKFFEGEWKDTVNQPTTDINRFYNQALRIVDENIATQLRVRLCSDVASPNKKIKEVDVPIKESAAALSGVDTTNAYEKKITDLHELVTKSLQGAQPNELFEMRQQIRDIQKDAEFEKHKAVHGKELEKMQLIINEREKDIEELATENEQLKGIITQKEADLQGLTSKQNAPLSGFGIMAAQILKEAGMGLIRDNKKFIIEGFNISEKVFDEHIGKKTAAGIDDNAAAKNVADPEPVEDWTGIDAEIKNNITVYLVPALKTLDKNRFMRFWLLMNGIFNDKGELMLDQLEIANNALKQEPVHP